MIRGREFVMQDAYSFDMTEEDLKKNYLIQRDAYERIFQRLHVPYVMVHATSGPMGGSASEEFFVAYAYWRRYIRFGSFWRSMECGSAYYSEATGC